MVRAKTSTTKINTETKDTQNNNKIQCSCCGKLKIPTNFYKSYSRINKYLQKMTVCKDCVLKLCKDLIEDSGDMKVGIFRTCMYVDIPFLETPYNSAIDQFTSENKIDIKENIDSQIKIFQLYLKNINSLNQYEGYTFENGENLNTKDEIAEKENLEIQSNMTDRDKQNESDVLRILGYDPFETENKKDRKFLFNRLVDMLDDSVLGDNVKLMSVISVVKGFNQLEYVDQAIALLTKDITQLNKNNGGIKSLVDTKKNLMSTVLKTCEDNGISTKFNNNKSKGSGTLTGMVKELGEMDLEEARVNLFDIQTAKGIRQCADISNEAIKKQLMFDENDYSEMVSWQRDELQKLQQKEEKLSEENRKLKVQIKKIDKRE